MFLRKTNNIIKTLRNISNEDSEKQPRKPRKPTLNQMFYDIPKTKKSTKKK
jgi:hypothetical protein